MASKPHVLEPHFKKLRRAVRLLDASEGRRVARRNARRRALAQVAALKAFLNEHWPALDKTGGEIRPARRAPKCPVCNKYYPTWQAVARHVSQRRRGHGWWTNSSYADFPYRCVCGLKCISVTRLGRHLGAVKDLKTHVTLSLIGRVGV